MDLDSTLSLLAEDPAALLVGHQGDGERIAKILDGKNRASQGVLSRRAGTQQDQRRQQAESHTTTSRPSLADLYIASITLRRVMCSESLGTSASTATVARK